MQQRGPLRALAERVHDLHLHRQRRGRVDRQQLFRDLRAAEAPEIANRRDLHGLARRLRDADDGVPGFRRGGLRQHEYRADRRARFTLERDFPENRHHPVHVVEPHQSAERENPQLRVRIAEVCHPGGRRLRRQCRLHDSCRRLRRPGHLGLDISDRSCGRGLRRRLRARGLATHSAPRARRHGHHDRRVRRHRRPPEHVPPLEPHRDLDPERLPVLHPHALRKIPLEPADRGHGRSWISRVILTVRQPVQRFVAPRLLLVIDSRAQLFDRQRPLLVGDEIPRAGQPLRFRRQRFGRAGPDGRCRKENAEGCCESMSIVIVSCRSSRALKACRRHDIHLRDEIALRDQALNLFQVR